MPIFGRQELEILLGKQPELSREQLKLVGGDALYGVAKRRSGCNWLALDARDGVRGCWVNPVMQKGPRA